MAITTRLSRYICVCVIRRSLIQLIYRRLLLSDARSMEHSSFASIGLESFIKVRFCVDDDHGAIRDTAGGDKSANLTDDARRPTKRIDLRDDTTSVTISSGMSSSARTTCPASF